MVPQWTKTNNEERKGSQAWWALYLQGALVFRNKTKGFCCPLLSFMLCHFNWWSFTGFSLHYTRCPLLELWTRECVTFWNHIVECSPCSACFSSVCGSAHARETDHDGVIACGIVLSQRELIGLEASVKCDCWISVVDWTECSPSLF